MLFTAWTADSKSNIRLQLSVSCPISSVIRFMINIPTAPPVWLLVDFLLLLSIIIDQFE